MLRRTACAFAALGAMYYEGKGMTPSCRRAREHLKRAIELGHYMSVKNMQVINGDIQEVR